jgi:phosphotransferase system enzyme I (PtsI)
MRGTAVSPGIGRGVAYVLAWGGGTPAVRREIAADEVAGELARFEAALAEAERDLLALKKVVDDSIGPSEGDIFAAQALVVRDPVLRTQVSALVRDQRINVESAVAEIVRGSPAPSTTSPTRTCASGRPTSATWAAGCSRR